jgi:hypothetical protein
LVNVASSGLRPNGRKRESSIRFHKCSQLFIRTQNETRAVAAMRVSNPPTLDQAW